MDNAYCLDTSALIESWWRLYRPGSFPSFWTRLEEAINGGVIIAPRIVFDEIKRNDDELHKWVFSRQSMFYPLTAELQSVQANIINSYPKLINETKGRSLCDPWVIALAQINNCPVITEERKGGNSRPKIPDVCEYLGVGCMKVADLIETLGWTF